MLSIGMLIMTMAQFSWSGNCGKIHKTKGTVRVIRGSQVLKAERKMKLTCADIIVTEAKSKAVLKLPHIRLAIGPNARLKVVQIAEKSDQDSQLDLMYGRMRAVFKRNSQNSETLPEPKSFLVKTPTAIAGVRGTDFVVSFDPNTRQTQQVTLTGEVLLQLLSSRESVLVKAGQTVTMNEPIPTGFMVASKGKKAPKKKTIIENKLDGTAQKQIDQELGFD